MPTYKIREDLKATFISSEYGIKGEPGQLIQTDIFLPPYLPVELVDPDNPPAIVDQTIDLELNPGEEHVVNLTKYHKKIQISLLNLQDDSVVYVYLDDEQVYRVVLTKELPDYVKEAVYYNLYKVRIKSPNSNTNQVKIRILLGVR